MTVPFTSPSATAESIMGVSTGRGMIQRRVMSLQDELTRRLDSSASGTLKFHYLTQRCQLDAEGLRWGDEKGRRVSERSRPTRVIKATRRRFQERYSDYPVSRRTRPSPPGLEDDFESELGDYGPGGTRKRLVGPFNSEGPPGGKIILEGANKFVLASVFVLGIGAGIAMSTLVNTEPSNVASRDVIDQKTPNPDICLANGFSAMVLDQRLFISFNPFNVYVSQAEVKPGCILRQSNWQVLESRGLVNTREVRDCKRNMNTFGFVGDLRQAPEVSCIYHSETAENQFLKDPAKATLGDGFQPRDFDQ